MLRCRNRSMLTIKQELLPKLEYIIDLLLRLVTGFLKRLEFESEVKLEKSLEKSRRATGSFIFIKTS